MLGVLRIARGVGLVQQAAGRHGQVICQRPAFGGSVLREDARLPVFGVGVRVNVKAAGENLIEVPARDDVVALLILGLDELAQLLCLGDLALAVVIGFEMQIDEHKLLVAPPKISRTSSS